MKIKKILAVMMITVMTVGMSFSSLAAGWVEDENGRRYATDEYNTEFYTNGWQLIDDDGDNYAESYYFDENGYVLTNTVAPGGHPVNELGQFNELGVVRTQYIGETDIPVPETVAEMPTGYASNGLGEVVIDLLNHTRAENAAKYGECKVIESQGNLDVYNFPDLKLYVEYTDLGNNENKYPVSLTAYDRESVLKCFKDAPMTGNQRQDYEKLKSLGYTTYSNASVIIDGGEFNGGYSIITYTALDRIDITGPHYMEACY